MGNVDIEELRRRIDELDLKLVQLLNERAGLAQQIGRAKHENSAPCFVPSRERQVFDRIQQANQGPLPDEALVSIYREIVAASRILERPMVVAYFGPPGTFTHLATQKKFGPLAKTIPAVTVEEVFRLVGKEEADFGVVPMENSTEGVESVTLDMFFQFDLRICAELYLDIHQCLLSNSPLEKITRIYSHRQALAQSRDWIKKCLPEALVTEVSSTSRAAEMAVAEPGSAAIGAESAASLYGLEIQARQIEDVPGNRTRFLMIGRMDSKPSGRDKTTIMFSVRHRAGALYRSLGALDRSSVNMTMIESRPTRLTPWEYLFFIDVQGHQHDPPVAAALEEMREECLFLKVLGSYPEAE